ncbi:hypothetical protein ACFCXH_17330 [Streptomyces nojiriensis]|uniref:hypothetical protein n=1 Tax=Streptomyces nojiriensis TaxID=66374 RepID=UPI0035D8B5D1
MEHTDRMRRASQQIQNMQTEMRGQTVNILQRPMLTTRLLTGDLRLGQAEAVGEDVLTYTGPRHQRGDRQPEKLFRTHHHHAILASLILKTHQECRN